MLMRLGVLLLLAAAASAHADTTYRFDLPEQPLAESLRAIARQTGANILFESRNLKGINAPAVRAELTVAQALDRVLAGTKLGVQRTTPSTVIVQPLEQAEESGNVVLEEIVVTAQKRVERAFDVPISIVALGDEELQRRRIRSIEDLALAVPGLSVQSSGGHQRRIALRGISNVFGSSSLIGLYLDEASVATAPTQQLDLRTYDLERVEVLRGPQGTLYGEGSVGGTIRFITRNPSLDELAMKADVTALFTEDGEPGQRLESVLNVPLVRDQLGLRIAGTFDHAGGWIDQLAAGREDFNDQDLINVRAKGLWQPTPQLAVNAMLVVHRNNGPISDGEDEAGNYSQVFNLTAEPAATDDYDLSNLTLTYDFSAFRLLSATTHIDQDKNSRNVGARFPLLGPGQPLLDYFSFSQIQRARSTSEELRLSSICEGPWTWTVGGFYRRAQLDARSAIFFGLPGPPGTPLPAPIAADRGTLSKSWAAFGDASFRLTDRFTLGAGLRYFNDDQEKTLGPAETAEFASTNPRLYAQYRLTDRINTYASAGKGFRSGGFNQSNQPAFDPESVWTYELGTKMVLLDGRLSSDAALFYSDYTDYQIVGIPPGGPSLSITGNAGSARIKGIEWALAWRPLDEWTLSLSGTYVKSEFYEINAASTSHAVGDPLDMFPKYGVTVSAQRDFRWSGKPVYARLDYDRHGRSTYRNRSFGLAYFSESDIVGLLNLNASLQWNERLSIGLFGQNLLNERGYLDPFSIEESATRSRPRTYGVQFGVSFD